MTFSYPNADLGLIIKSYQKDGCNYHIEYLDGSINDYVCYDDKEESRIVSTMFEQAIKRQEMYDIDEYGSKIAIFLGLKIGFLVSFVLAFEEKNVTMEMVMFTLAFISSRIKNKNFKMRQELLKYKCFLELVKDKNVLDNPSIEDLDSEFDKIYCAPIDINTLDKHSYSDIKRIYKKYKKREK